MPASTRISLIFSCLCGFFLTIPQAGAGQYNSTIEKVSLFSDKNWYKLNADINFHLSPVAVEALQNSISLVWNIRLKLYQQRKFLWDQELLDYSLKYRVRYQALLNMYQVKNEDNGEIRRFFSQLAAFNFMRKIRNLKVVQQDLIQQPGKVSAALKVQFDREALPLPLRPVSYFDQQWDLSSNWLQWQIQE